MRLHGNLGNILRSAKSRGIELPENEVIPGFIYEIDGLNVLVIPVTARRGGLVFHDVNLDVRGNVFRGGGSPYQPDEDGRILVHGESTGKTLEDLQFASEGQAQDWDPVPMDSSQELP